MVVPVGPRYAAQVCLSEIFEKEKGLLRLCCLNVTVGVSTPVMHKLTMFRVRLLARIARTLLTNLHPICCSN